MKTEEIGEFGLIDLILETGAKKDCVQKGIGDDCAVLKKNDTEFTLLSCDLLTEGVHFLRNEITPEDLGYKAVAVNLSDIAAMGGNPETILISVAMPKNIPVEGWKRFYKGVDEICKEFEVALIGGDTTGSEGSLTVNVTVTGTVEQDRIHYRSDAKPGDVLFVTGPLGGSRAGLEILLNKEILSSKEEREYLMQKHYRPVPRCKEVRVLDRLCGNRLHALNDISDGLSSESREIAEASHVKLVLDKSRIPVDSGALKLSEENGRDAFLWALTGGEDFELLGTMDFDSSKEIQKAYEEETGKKLYMIGYVEEGEGVFLKDSEKTEALRSDGFNHFTEKK